jgi:oligopeptide/dipeptide ABC transporter ATP-binding protein
MDLIADHISHRFGALEVLDDVSFTVGAGEVVAIVGPSGCGKSTLLSILGGLLQPSAGAAKWRGAPPAGSLNPLTFVFQDFALLPWDTVEANVEFPLLHAPLAPAERRALVDDALRRTGLADFRRAYPKQLSGGMRQRVGIARALAVRPAMLVCDEAVAALDVSIQAQVLNLFMALREELKLTYLFISHDLGVVRHLCDRVVIMYLGRVVETAATQDIYAAPNHPYTQALLNDVPRIDGRHRTYTPVQGEIASPYAPPPGCQFHPRCPHAMLRLSPE